MSNPVFNIIPSNQDDNYNDGNSFGAVKPMTVDGTLQVAGINGLILMFAAMFCYSRFTIGYTDMGAMLMGTGGIVGFILALVIIFSVRSVRFNSIKYLIPVYAVCEGFLLGGVSASMEAAYPGIVSSALLGTLVAFFSMLVLYRMRIISATDKFKSTVFIATLSVLVIYAVDMIGHLFGHSVPVLYSSSTLGILVSSVIVIIAALNLIIDFDFIEQCSVRGVPSDYEWYGAFGLMVTIVWMYIEILNLLAKLQRK
ncbi:MAG: Bax inhibitor-1/YccA family protein [bacterium]|nr:Bax inhibitor-1/YccA family protein [bacterium]